MQVAGGMRVLIILLLGCTIPCLARGGDKLTREDVVAQLGRPISVSTTGEREVLNYPEFTVLLEGGEVIGLTPKPKVPAHRIPSLRPRVAELPAPVRFEPQVPPALPPPTPQVRTVLRDQQRPTTPETVPFDPMGGVLKSLLWSALFFGAMAVAGSLIVLTAKKRGRRGGKKFSSNPTEALMPTEPASPHPPLVTRRPDALKDGWSLPLLKQIEWHGFERLVADYYRAIGRRAELTTFGADGGVDVEVFDGDFATPSLLVQCKAFDEELIGVKLVRELYGVAAARQISGTAFFTTSDFTPDAREFASRVGMELVAGTEFIDRLKSLSLPESLSLFERATKDDFTTPTCPSCGVKMVQRVGSSGRSDPFWGCVHFPRCRQTLRCKRV